MRNTLRLVLLVAFTGFTAAFCVRWVDDWRNDPSMQYNNPFDSIGQRNPTDALGRSAPPNPWSALAPPRRDHWVSTERFLFREIPLATIMVCGLLLLRLPIFHEKAGTASN